jgi:hypothetical protein
MTAAPFVTPVWTGSVPARTSWPMAAYNATPL